ncbi:hypothetical protein ACN27F_12670 [Solwaraspora sp. WMMB335]|uniref:hypothetical protein n=1 Tax=Solwaraspora sp. WMMB335 TaxID=3404118 RepID=UPI003B9465C5
MGVALLVSGLTVLAGMWRTLWPGRTADGADTGGSADGWTVAGAWTVVDAHSCPAGPDTRAGPGRRRHRGRRRAGRGGLRRRAAVVGRHPLTAVPRQRSGEPAGWLAGQRPSPPPSATVVLPPPATPVVPVIGTTVTGRPFRGVVPMPDGRYLRE